MDCNPADDFLYILHDSCDILAIALNAEDLLIGCGDTGTLSHTKQEISKRFKMKNLGESHVISGIHIARDRESRTVTIMKDRYAQNITDRFGMGCARGLLLTCMCLGVDVGTK